MTLQKNNIIQNLNKRLSVQLSLSGLSFLVTNPINKEIVHFSKKIFPKPISPEQLLLELKSNFNENKELNNNFIDVNIIYNTTLYTLTPSSLFNPSKASEYLKFNSKILINDFIAYDEVKNHDIIIVYIPFVNINNYLFDKFGDFNYYHSSTVLLQHILDKEKSFKLPKVYLNVSNNSFDFLAIKNGGLQICNTYEFNTPEDFIYYTLFCLEQLKLNPDSVDLYVTGSIKKEDENYSILYNYIRNISFYNYLEEISFSKNENSHQNLLLKLV